MKKLSTKILKSLGLVLCCLGMHSSHAQTDTFAPVGAEWYHYREAADISNTGKYLFHSRSVSDTTIDNQSCRKIETTYQVVSNTLGWPLNPSVGNLFVYNTQDTVFVYNTLFNKFTPLYVYNVSVGDTVCLPVVQTTQPDERPNPIANGDTSFCFVIDSIKTVLYDTAHLETYYFHPLYENNADSVMLLNYPAMMYNNMSNNCQLDTGVNGGLYKDFYIKHIAGNLLPDRQLGYMPTAEELLDARIGSNGAIRCYSDGNYSIQLNSGVACDSIVPYPTSSVNNLKEALLLNIYPNPAKQNIYLDKIASVNGDLSISITDAVGRVLLQSKFLKQETHKEINLQSFCAGLYFLTIESNGKKYFQKLVKE